MTPGLFAVIAVAVITGFVLLIVVAVRAAKKRDQRYRAGCLGWATARGWAYQEGGGGPWQSMLSKGDGRRGVKLQMDGTSQGRPLTVAHYWYQTTSTSTDSEGRSSTSTTTHSLVVVALRLAASYPAVALERRGLGWGVGLAAARAVGRRPANLTGAGEFDRRYRIRAKSPGASALVTPQVISAYLSGNLPQWKLSGDQFVITWPGPVKVDALDQQVGQVLATAALLGI